MFPLENQVASFLQSWLGDSMPDLPKQWDACLFFWTSSPRVWLITGLTGQILRPSHLPIFFGSWAARRTLWRASMLNSTKPHLTIAPFPIFHVLTPFIGLRVCGAIPSLLHRVIPTTTTFGICSTPQHHRIIWAHAIQRKKKKRIHGRRRKVSLHSCEAGERMNKLKRPFTRVTSTHESCLDIHSHLINQLITTADLTTSPKRHVHLGNVGPGLQSVIRDEGEVHSPCLSGNHDGLDEQIIEREGSRMEKWSRGPIRLKG